MRPRNPRTIVSPGVYVSGSRYHHGMAPHSKPTFSLVEICAGAGGQSLGLHRAGFQHELAVELDPTAAETLAQRGWNVAVGDVADSRVWSPGDYSGVDLFAGGVPCPPFSMAGQQLGSEDERDLFAWAIEQVGVVRPRAVLLENVRGLSTARFSAYRQRVLDRLAELGYLGSWRVLQAADYGVPQLRPRFVLVAMRPEDASYFRWPDPFGEQMTVGAALHDLMAENGWSHAEEWRTLASSVGPTLVGGSKKHGGADLGPTRAKAAWAKLYVDGRGIADAPPAADAGNPRQQMPRLTLEMAARIQGWQASDEWRFAGRKTAQYRQIGNAFPPPVAKAIGLSIYAALRHEGSAQTDVQLSADVHDPVYRTLARGAAVTMSELLHVLSANNRSHIERMLTAIRQDFELEETFSDGESVFRLGAFKGFTGQTDHGRHDYYSNHQNLVS